MIDYRLALIKEPAAIRLSSKFPAIMEPEGRLSCLQEFAIDSCHKTGKSSPHPNIIFRYDLF
jgi:hypothetical protein